MFTSIFCVPPPRNIRPLKTNSATSTMITKITSTATTPTLPPPPPSSAMTISSCLFDPVYAGGKGKGVAFWSDPILLRIDSVSTATATNRARRLNVAGLNRRRGARWRGAARHDPKLNTVLLTEATVDNNETRFIDASLLGQIIAGASHQSLDLSDRTGATAVSDDVTSRRRIVLKFDGQVVETRFLIVEGAVVALVKRAGNDHLFLFRGNHRNRLRSLLAQRIDRTIIDRKGRNQAL